MELEFIKRGNNYEAIFEVPSGFNIHIGLNEPSYLGVYQDSIQKYGVEQKLSELDL